MGPPRRRQEAAADRHGGSGRRERRDREGRFRAKTEDLNESLGDAPARPLGKAPCSAGAPQWGAGPQFCGRALLAITPLSVEAGAEAGAEVRSFRRSHPHYSQRAHSYFSYRLARARGIPAAVC